MEQEQQYGFLFTFSSFIRSFLFRDLGLFYVFMFLVLTQLNTNCKWVLWDFKSNDENNKHIMHLTLWAQIVNGGESFVYV